MGLRAPTSGKATGGDRVLNDSKTAVLGGSSNKRSRGGKHHNYRGSREGKAGRERARRSRRERVEPLLQSTYRRLRTVYVTRTWCIAPIPSPGEYHPRVINRRVHRARHSGVVHGVVYSIGTRRPNSRQYPRSVLDLFVWSRAAS